MGRKRKRSKAASPVKFSKKVVVAILAEVTVFTVAMVAVYMKTGGDAGHPHRLLLLLHRRGGRSARSDPIRRFQVPEAGRKHQHRRRGLHQLRRRRRIKKGHLP